MGTTMNALRRTISMTKRLAFGVGHSFLTAAQTTQLTSEIQGLGTAPTAAQMNKVSGDIYVANQTGRVAHLLAMGKITQDQATQLDGVISSSASSVSGSQMRLKDAFSLERSDLRQDFAANAAAPTPAGSSSSAAA